MTPLKNHDRMCGLAVLTVACVLTAANSVHAQSNYTSYSDYYSRNAATAPSPYLGSNAYLYNKYFTSNPAISPYVSGAVLGSSSLDSTAYLSTVLPEQQRREQAARSQAAMVQQRKMQGNVGYTVNPGAYYGGAPGSGTYQNQKASRPKSGAYQNHWYGSWNR